jgi:hypothetical protein
VVTLLAGGQSVEEVCKKLEVSPPTYHQWRQEYGGVLLPSSGSGSFFWREPFGGRGGAFYVLRAKM